ncbi:MAG: squalene/phytoene synthase family protein, partial [Actinobacteria bacterium]|nr:squalene/phytoene synthase family protein [Actinomycetota bacterium]
LPSADSAEVARLADELGVGLQLTNILRDIREDLLNDRVYLPAKDLELFGVELRIGADGALDPCGGRLAELIRFEAARAWGWYDRGLKLLDVLDRRSAACCAAMAGIYHELLRRIAADPSQVMAARMSLPATVKLRVAVGALAGGGRSRG